LSSREVTICAGVLDGALDVDRPSSRAQIQTLKRRKTMLWTILVILLVLWLLGLIGGVGGGLIHLLLVVAVVVLLFNLLSGRRAAL
jgi:uncharacterized membrane protein